MPQQVPLSVNPSSRTCSSSRYALGSAVSGSWTTGDCTYSASGRKYDMYEFTITEQAAFRAQITGPTGRRVSLRRSDTQDYVQLMASEAWMPSASNPLEVRYVLAPGSYVFEVASPDSVTWGSYTLSTAADAGVTCRPVVFVTAGVTIRERLDRAVDCASPGGIGVEDLFIILPKVGVRLDMTVETAAFAPLVVYRDDRQGPLSPTLTRDVRHTVGATARTSYTTTFTGFQEIIVSHANAGGSGAYTLTIAEGDAANTCAPMPTTLAGSRLAFWESTDCLSEGRLYDAYDLTLAAQSALRVQLASPPGSKTAGVYTGGKEVLNFLRTSGDLNATWFLAPGEYQLRVGVPSAAAPSSYSLATPAASTSITCTNNATTGNVTFSAQTIGAAGDCFFPEIGKYEDRLSLFVDAGKEIVLTMTSSVAPQTVIRNPSTPPGTFLVLQRGTDPGTVTATWRAQYSGYYQVIFSTAQPNASGSYSGSIVVR